MGDEKRDWGRERGEWRIVNDGEERRGRIGKEGVIVARVGMR